MKEYIIYSDTHFGAPHAIGNMDEIISSPIENVILLGDLIDIANTRKRHIGRFVKALRTFEEKFSDHYVSGNHECRYKISPLIKVIDGVLFTHGHTLYWPYEKVVEWQNKKGGRGKFSRLIYSVYKNYLMGNKHYKAKHKDVPDEVKERCLKICKENNCHTIVFGHTHHFDDCNYEGIRIVNVPRGRTEIKL